MVKNICVVFVLFVATGCHSLSGWTSIFDGKSLDGWELAKGKNGKAKFEVKSRTILGTAKKEYRANSFLCTKKEYGDFILKFDVKLQEPLNSGVQIRSKSLAKKNNYRVHGPQVEIAGDKRGFSGYIYGEAIKEAKNGLWLTSPKNKVKHNHFRPNRWNNYRVKATGNTVSTWINGNFISEITHPAIPKRGFIGLQVHHISTGGPYKVQWKNIKIKEL